MQINDCSIFQGDCVTLMNQIITENPEFKVDAIITDPPYNISRNHNFGNMGRSGLDFGQWDHNADIISWLDPATQLLKDGGNIIIFNDWKNMGLLAGELEARGYIIKDMIRWVKSNPMPRNRDRRFVSDCEYAVWATKGKGWIFNRLNDTYDRPEIIAPIQANAQHPTQKPVSVMAQICHWMTNRGDIVLDPYMGSGSTGVAARQLYRRFVGLELDQGYWQVASNRLASLS